MSLKIENAEDFAQLLANVEHDFGQLQGLLVKLQDKDPAIAKEELVQEERLRNEKLALKERMRNLLHAEPAHSDSGADVHGQEDRVG
jgi:hypothetical protein